MGNTQTHADKDAEEEAAKLSPEGLWLPFIHEMYPNLHRETYLFPPIHFRRTPHSVHTVSGQTVKVRDNPPASKKRRPKRPPTPPPGSESSPQVAETVFTSNPPDLKSVHVQESDLQDEEAHERCLQALANLSGQVMIVISRLEFRKYLDNATNPERLSNPLHALAASQLPSIVDPSVPPTLVDGECDILIIHRHHGLVIGEVKSVGAGQFFSQQSVCQQSQMIVRKVDEAVTQLNNQERALRHLVHDLPALSITKTLLLPNLTSAQLRAALASSDIVTKALCQCMDKKDVSKALRKCLCQDQMAKPSSWQAALTKRADPHMTASIYERLVARFCGPASTVDIPTAGPPRKVLRTVSQAVAETGLCCSSLTLTPTQIQLLNRQPEPDFLFLHGPPGTGKTVVLVLKALQWALQNRQVVILSVTRSSDPVTTLMEKQLHGLLAGSAASASSSSPSAAAAAVAAAANVRRFCYDFYDSQFDARAAAGHLQQQLKPGPVLVLFDELDVLDRQHFFQWSIDLRRRIPEVCLWAAGMWRLDASLTTPLPPWVEIQTLQEPLRCPPSVVKQLKGTDFMRAKMVPMYSDPVLPVPTEGPEVRVLRHKDQPGHDAEDRLRCQACAENIGLFLTKELRVGQPGHPLQYRDVWILCTQKPRSAKVVVQHLQTQHRLPVRQVTVPASEDDQRDLALAISDQILLTQFTAVQGLERRVVVGMTARSLETFSRCTGSLCVVD